MRALAVTILAIAWLALLAGYVSLFATCKPGDWGYSEGGVLLAGCR